jgi:hypothetical protein
MVDYILDPAVFKGTEVRVLNYEEAIDDKIMFTKPLVMMLRFNILPSIDIINGFLEGKQVDEKNSWFNNDRVIAKMGKEFKSFLKFAKANEEESEQRGFLVGLYDTNTTHTNVYAQKEGEILSTDFQFPPQPPQLVEASNEYNSVKFKIARPANKWVQHISLKYWKFAR